MRIERHYTKAGQSPYAGLDFRTTKSEIRNPDGSIVFSPEGIEVPAAWSQVASDVLAQKYFRKAGVPARLKRVEEDGVPSFLWRREADEAALADLAQGGALHRETQREAIFDRLAGAWTYWGWKGGYFDSDEGRRAPSSTKSATCSPRRSARRTRRNGSTPGCTGPTASTVRPGPLLRRSPDRQGARLEVRLRAPAAARLLHPVGRRRPRQRGRHHGSVGARGAAVQIRLRHRLQFLEAARRRRETVGRRPLVRPDVAS